MFFTILLASDLALILSVMLVFLVFFIITLKSR